MHTGVGAVGLGNRDLWGPVIPVGRFLKTQDRDSAFHFEAPCQKSLEFRL